MSPVPEPMQGGRENQRNGDDEGISPPAGLMMGPPMSSSDEEAEQVDSEDPNLSGYQPLPQDFDEEHEESVIDYSSLNGLMAALNTHGPNVIEDENEAEEPQQINDTVDGNSIEGGTNPGVSSCTADLFQQSMSQSKEEESKERAALWNSPQEDRLSLDGNKVEEIKSVMASFTLPQSAIPAWAQNISEEDWKSQIAGLISKKDTQ